MYVENDDSKKKQFGSKMVILVVVKCCVHSVDSKTGIICEQDLWHIRKCVIGFKT